MKQSSRYFKIDARMPCPLENEGRKRLVRMKKARDRKRKR